jgi:ribonuclease HI
MPTSKLKLIIYSDGGARGNPGPAGAGAVILDADNRQVLHELSEFLGETTNNQAEYRALILALEKAVELEPASICCYLDSELLVEQLCGRYKVKNPELKLRFLEAMQVIGTHSVSFHHIPREKNQHADALANQAMDQGTAR